MRRAVHPETKARQSRVFVNIASCGLSGDIADLVNRRFKFLGTKMAYNVAAAVALLTKR